MLTLKEAVQSAARRYPDKLALVFDVTGERLTFAELDRRSNAFAHALLQAGIKRGDRIAVATANCAAFPIAWLGITKIAAAMVPLNPAYRREDASHLLDVSQAKVIVCDDERLALYLELKDHLPELTLVIHAGEDTPAAATSFEHFLGQGAPTAPDVPVYPETLANLQFTSGTTGLPKGCMLSHAYWMTAAHAINADIIQIRDDDVMLTAQAFTYLDPQWNLVVALLAGATLVVLDRFHPSRFWAKVCEYDVTFFYCLAAMPNLMLAMPVSPQERLHRVRLVMCSAIPRDRHAVLEERFGVPWREAYGTTETGGDIAVRPENHLACVGSGALGVAMSHREIRIIDEQNCPVPRGDVGELVVRGLGMMDGYWRNAEATAAAFRNGWYHTGDLAYFDAEGRVHLAGRQKDMIRRSGENIAAVEVEGVIQQHPSVALAACIAVPDALRGEELKAFIVLREEYRAQPPEPETLAAFVAGRLAAFKVPRYWEYRDDLPRTASERVAKPLLRDQARGAAEYDRQADR